MSGQAYATIHGGHTPENQRRVGTWLYKTKHLVGIISRPDTGEEQSGRLPFQPEFKIEIETVVNTKKSEANSCYGDHIKRGFLDWLSGLDNFYGRNTGTYMWMCFSTYSLKIHHPKFPTLFYSTNTTEFKLSPSNSGAFRLFQDGRFLFFRTSSSDPHILEHAFLESGQCKQLTHE